MDKFCDGKFWDLNQTWNSEVPDFSLCFQETILTSLPCILYSLILFVHLCLLPRPVVSHSSLPWTWLNVSKMISSVALLTMSVVWCTVTIHDKFFTSTVSPSSIMSSCAKVLVFVLIAITRLKHKSLGVTTSIILSTFWLIFSLCSIVVYRSAILRYFYWETESREGVFFVLNMLFYPIVFIELILSAFTDKRKFTALEEEQNVMEQVSFLSYLSFLWFVKIVYLSKKRLLKISDLSFLTIHLTSKVIYASFEKNWNHYLLPDQTKNPSLLLALVKSFFPWFIGTIALDLMFLVLLLVPPLILDRIIDFATHDEYVWRGYLFVALIFLTDFVGKIIQNQAINFMSYSCVQLQVAVLGAMFRKNLNMSTGARKEYPSGNIMSLVTVDTKRIQWFTIQFSTLITAPLKIILIIYILSQYVGIASLAGVAVIGILFPLSYVFSRYAWKFSDKQMQIKDIRLKLMTEILSGIKILKLYAWEIPFAGRVYETRKDEIKMVRYSFLCYVITSAVYFMAPFTVSIACFATYLMLDANNVLSPTKAFVTLTLMEQLRYALFELPDAISDLIQFNISLSRLREFFGAENKNDKMIGSNPRLGEAISLKEASFTWSAGSEDLLKNISLNVPVGKLIAIIGPVGSGKSSLLSAILGEMYKNSGSVDVKGSIAYVPQQPWVLNRSLKDNILLVKHMVEEKYNKILTLCCLRPDLEILPAGDCTEIGEKGVNLSGGQKLRTNLAQAVYQDKDIYLLDDPLSAVDVHVRKSLFKDIIGNTGLLRKKTRILVTHDISVLPNVDLIVSMKDGQIEEIGTYSSLLNSRGSFTSFVEEHFNVNAVEENKPKLESAPKIERSLSRLISTDSTLSKISGGGDHVSPAKILDVDDDEYRLIDDERMEVGGVHRHHYWSYIKKSVLFFVLAAFWYMAYNGFQAGANIWLSKWSADSSKNNTQNNGTDSTLFRLTIYGTLGLAEILSAAAGTTFLVYASTRASETYHNVMLDRVMKSPMSFFDSTPMGRIVNRFSTDLEVLDNQILFRVEGFLNCIFGTIASFVIIGMNTPMFLISIIPLGILYYSIQMLHLNAFRQIKRLESTARSPVYSLFLEAIQGVSSISAYGVKKDFINIFDEKVDNCFVCTFNTFVCNRWLNSCLDTLGSLVILFATWLAVDNRLSLGPSVVGLMISYALTVTDSMKWFVRMNSELEDKSISIERSEEYCKLEPEAAWDVPHEDLCDAWPQKGNVVFYDYSTRYRENLDLVLKEINLSLNGGEKVGIVGRTGAGKSSFTLALFRIIEPAEGIISIDNIDISKIGLHNLRSKLTIIPQDTVLFTGTLRVNLDPNNEHTDEEIWSCLEQSHLKEYVSTLSEGLEYEIDESGANLSSGQRQLVCLARALLKNSKILVLDEATASVDMATDSLIQNTIRTAFADRTVITIAHRINTVLDYDKIVIMESGNVVEVGKPTDLLADSNSKFYHMNKEAGLL